MSVDLDALDKLLADAKFAGEWLASRTRCALETTQTSNSGEIYGLNEWTPDEPSERAKAEAALIVGAVNALPALIAELRAFRGPP